MIFDNGDEVLIEDEHGLPADIMVADHTGTFVAFDTDIYQLAAVYAAPVNRRVAHVANPSEFADAYVGACLGNFARIQREYRDRRRAFDSLFADRPRDEAGSLAYRWERVLRRLDEANLNTLEAAIRKNLGALRRCKTINYRIHQPERGRPARFFPWRAGRPRSGISVGYSFTPP